MRPEEVRAFEQAAVMAKEGAAEAFRGGTKEERVERIMALQAQIANDLGLNPNDERVKQVIRKAIQEARGGGGMKKMKAEDF